MFCHISYTSIKMGNVVINIVLFKKILFRNMGKKGKTMF